MRADQFCVAKQAFSLDMWRSLRSQQPEAWVKETASHAAEEATSAPQPSLLQPGRVVAAPFERCTLQCNTCIERERESLQSESQTPTRGQTDATRRQAKGGRRREKSKGGRPKPVKKSGGRPAAPCVSAAWAEAPPVLAGVGAAQVAVADRTQGGDQGGDMQCKQREWTWRAWGRRK